MIIMCLANSCSRYYNLQIFFLIFIFFFFDILMFLQFMIDDDSKYIGVSLIFETQ